METLLSQKTVLITGALGGIGQALAARFADEGARLVLHCRRDNQAARDWLSQQPWNSQAMLQPGDVRSIRDMQALFSTAEAESGSVDVVIANAGVWPSDYRLLHQMPESRIREVLEVNLFGALWTARAFFEHLARRPPHPEHGACLLLIGSTAGRFGEAGHTEYATSKAALYGMLRSLKNEITQLDPRGRVNLIEPGWTATPMAADGIKDTATMNRVYQTRPLRDIATPDDIAHTAVFLASPRTGRHISGEVITVSGGMEGRVLW